LRNRAEGFGHRFLDHDSGNDDTGGGRGLAIVGAVGFGGAFDVIVFEERQHDEEFTGDAIKEQASKPQRPRRGTRYRKERGRKEKVEGGWQDLQ